MSKQSGLVSRAGRKLLLAPGNAFKKFRRLNKNIQLASVLVAVLLVVGGVALLSGNEKIQQVADKLTNQAEDTTSNDENNLGANLVYLDGVVEFRTDTGEWMKAEKDAPISAQNGVRTSGAASRAIVRLEDNSEIRLDASTEIIFDSLTKDRVIIEQKSGNVYSRVVPTENRDYIVNTEKAHFQANGTAFRTIASGDEEAVEVYQSSVKETIANTSVKEGEKLVAKNHQNDSLSGTVEKIDIEKIKEEPFIIWNRDLDKASTLFKSSLGFLGDFDGPTIDIIDPVAGSSIDLPEGSSTGTITIRGKTEAKATLTILSKSVAGSGSVNVTVGDDGSFDSGPITGAAGTSVFELIATDKVGNKTISNVSYNFRKKTVQAQGITLSVTQSGGKVTLQWTLAGMTTPDGVKILYDDASGTTFEDDAVELVADGTTSKVYNSTSFTKNKVWYFRVCRYIADASTCDISSNEESVKIEF